MSPYEIAAFVCLGLGMVAALSYAGWLHDRLDSLAREYGQHDRRWNDMNSKFNAVYADLDRNLSQVCTYMEAHASRVLAQPSAVKKAAKVKKSK